jgi:hypothetical protein
VGNASETAPDLHDASPTPASRWVSDAGWNSVLAAFTISTYLAWLGHTLLARIRNRGTSTPTNGRTRPRLQAGLAVLAFAATLGCVSVELMAFRYAISLDRWLDQRMAELDLRQRMARLDLRLMSWGDGSGAPTEGKNLVVAGTDNDGLLHIRIFDATGYCVADTDETSLPAQAAAFATLKQRLPGLLPPHVLTDDEKAQVDGEVTSIFGGPRTTLVGDYPLSVKELESHIARAPESRTEGELSYCWTGIARTYVLHVFTTDRGDGDPIIFGYRFDW